MPHQQSHTPGPWGWFCNAKTKQIYLATQRGGRRFVMSFTRWGMQGAQPQFNSDDCILVDGELCGNEPDHNGEFDLTHPDALLIEAAPDLLEACEITLRLMKENGHTHDSCRGDDNILDQYDTFLSAPLSSVLEAAIAKATGK